MSPRPFDRAYGLVAVPLLALVLFGLVCPLAILAPTRAARRFCARHGIRLALALVGVPLRVRGAAQLPPGPCVLVANHASYADGLVLMAALPPRFTFVVQDGVAQWPYVGSAIRRVDMRFVNRGNARDAAAQTRALLRDLQAGASLAIFAEGRFEAAPGLLPFKSGAFLLAARVGVPVVPVGIRGTRHFLGDGQWLPRWTPIEIDIGAPIAATQHALELRAATRAAVLALCGESDRSAAGAAA